MNEYYLFGMPYRPRYTVYCRFCKFYGEDAHCGACSGAGWWVIDES